MSDPGLAIQQAYVARLKLAVSAVTGRVHDEAPQNVAFPFLQIGDIQTVEDGADCIDASECFITLHIWTRSVGHVEARQLVSACRAALHEWRPDLTAAGFRCVEHQFRSARILDDPDGKTRHAVMTLRMLVDLL